MTPIGLTVPAPNVNSPPYAPYASRPCRRERRWPCAPGFPVRRRRSSTVTPREINWCCSIAVMFLYLTGQAPQRMHFSRSKSGTPFIRRRSEPGGQFVVHDFADASPGGTGGCNRRPDSTPHPALTPLSRDAHLIRLKGEAGGPPPCCPAAKHRHRRPNRQAFPDSASPEPPRSLRT